MSATSRSAVNKQIERVQNLVFIRRLLAERGAGDLTLAECDGEIERQRETLAGLVQGSAARPIAA